MGQFIHLDPEERKEIVENIVEKLEERLTDVVKTIVGNYAITEPEILERVTLAANIAINEAVKKRLQS